MTDFKRRALHLNTGKQIKMFGNSLAIGKSLEIGEGYAPNIFSFVESQLEDKSAPPISNPHKLTPDELYEIADYNIRLWMDLKDNIRKYGANSPRVFNSDALR
jgi:hypothetical protein